MIESVDVGVRRPRAIKTTNSAVLVERRAYKHDAQASGFPAYSLARASCLYRGNNTATHS